MDYLDNLEGRPADALKGLQSYDFLSPEAEAKFQELTDKLRQQMMQQYFKGAEQALQNMTPEDLAAHEEHDVGPQRDGPQAQPGEPYDFENFMQQYGDFFPENPQNLEELLETLAQRIAQAQAMMNSMSPEMRQRLEELMGRAHAGRRPRVPDERARRTRFARRCPATCGISSTSSAATSRST